MDKNTILRNIPKIDEVLQEEQILSFYNDTSRELIREAARETIEEIRIKVLNGEGKPDCVEKKKVIGAIIEKIKEKKKKNLVRTINATGVVLHTNLGRALMSKAVADAVADTAMNYSNLEYDLDKGARGSRHDHVEKIITKITGAEAAMVVNNNAAATMLCLSVMGSGQEVIVSRGELVEIGGSFRVPDIMEQSGCILKEIGTTNKTKVADYKDAISDETGAILKVHTSNYKILGFTEEANLNELVELGKEKSLPVIYDMGSGLMVDLKDYGVTEPTVKECLDTGIDIILFSGDKLLGGPQGGIIVGKKEYIDKMKKHQLARVIRMDKMSLAAMEVTFREYISEENAKKEIPTLRMLTATYEDLIVRAENFSEVLSKAIKNLNFIPEETHGQVGGGSAPTVLLKGAGIAIDSDKISAEKLEKKLREYSTPIITRINKDKLYIEMRTITEEEKMIILEALKEIDNLDEVK